MHWEALAFIKNGLQFFDDTDSNGQRFPKVIHTCHKAFAPYVIFEEKKKKTIQGTAVDTDDPQQSIYVV